MAEILFELKKDKPSAYTRIDEKGLWHPGLIQIFQG